MRLGDLDALEKQFREDAENAVCYEERKTLEQCVRDVMAAPTISHDSPRSNQWISATEPPLLNGEYLVVIRGAKSATTLFYEDGEWWDGVDTYYPVALWMPLPEPPKGETNEANL